MSLEKKEMSTWAIGLLCTQVSTPLVFYFNYIEQLTAISHISDVKRYFSCFYMILKKEMLHSAAKADPGDEKIPSLIKQVSN